VANPLLGRGKPAGTAVPDQPSGSGGGDRAAVYREHWQIERLFRALKQNLRIKTFVGTIATVLTTQIWTALIALGREGPAIAVHILMESFAIDRSVRQ
jgi:hypothetical protein